MGYLVNGWKASPSSENRPADKGFNATVGTSVGPGIFPLGDRPCHLAVML
jgi:hypothetical protein